MLQVMITLSEKQKIYVFCNDKKPEVIKQSKLYMNTEINVEKFKPRQRIK